MIKETIFFSHSSKDKQSMASLKRLIQERTGGVLDIFLSSDGESIPFGTNWIHSIEKGLNDAIIMYVFVTPNSIKSDWIYFESGFAYAKNVKVIPIGFGVSIEELRPPLNLLQGFNLSNYEGLNNIIKTINDECKTTFKEDFIESDFMTIYNHSTFVDSSGIWSIIDSFETRIYAYNPKGNADTRITPNFQESYDAMKNMIISEGIYTEMSKSILTDGLYIEKKEDEINIDIESTSIVNHFEKILEGISSAFEEKDTHYLTVNLNEKYEVLGSHLKISTLLKKDERLNFFKDDIEWSPKYTFKSIYFAVDKLNDQYKGGRVDPSEIPEYRLRIVFNTKEDISSDVIELVQLLYDIGIIYRNEDKKMNK